MSSKLQTALATLGEQPAIVSGAGGDDLREPEP